MINKWRQTPEANEEHYKDGKRQKTKNEQLTTPMNIGSPTQLAILFYDILKIEPFNKKTPRSTGEAALKKIEKDIPIAKIILKIRGVEKLLGTYIDKIPTILSPRDGRLHGEFLQFGADTGRFSSKNPNLQNIPARGDITVRRMFTASEEYSDKEVIDNSVKLYEFSEVLTNTGWKLVKDLVIGDVLLNNTEQGSIINIVDVKPNMKRIDFSQ